MGLFVLPQLGITGRYLQQECGAAASVRAGIPHPFKCAAAAVQLLSHPQTPCGCSDVLSHPLLITPPQLLHPQLRLVGVRTSYHIPWFITPPLAPLRAALYHPGYTRYHTPHMIPHPFLNPKMLSPGCFILYELWFGPRLTCDFVFSFFWRMNDLIKL